MNRQLLLCLGLTLLAFAACQKKDEPAPEPAPEPVKEEVVEPEEIVEPEKPQVEVAEPSKEVTGFDPSRYNFEDIYFDFDKSDLRDNAVETLNRYVSVLRANPDLKVLIEGHCDERGTEEYNLALGERRSSRVKSYLVTAGISESRIKTISYGELRPKAQGSSEEAWALNRRAHFKLSQ